MLCCHPADRLVLSLPGGRAVEPPNTIEYRAGLRSGGAFGLEQIQLEQERRDELLGQPAAVSVSSRGLAQLSEEVSLAPAVAAAAAVSPLERVASPVVAATAPAPAAAAVAPVGAATEEKAPLPLPAEPRGHCPCGAGGRTCSISGVRSSRRRRRACCRRGFSCFCSSSSRKFRNSSSSSSSSSSRRTSSGSSSRSTSTSVSKLKRICAIVVQFQIALPFIAATHSPPWTRRTSSRSTFQIGTSILLFSWFVFNTLADIFDLHADNRTIFLLKPPESIIHRCYGSNGKAYNSNSMQLTANFCIFWSLAVALTHKCRRWCRWATQNPLERFAAAKEEVDAEALSRCRSSWSRSKLAKKRHAERSELFKLPLGCTWLTSCRWSCTTSSSLH